MSIDHLVIYSVLAVTSLVSAGCDGALDQVTDTSRSVAVSSAEAAPAAKPRRAAADATAHAGEDEGGPDGDGSGIGFALQPAVHAELDAFGCEAASLGVFAGRYSSIEVFADIASLGPDRYRTAAKVIGQLSVGLPNLLSGAYIEWDLAWLSTSDTVLLYGSALTPAGDTVVAQMNLPRDAGVHGTAINTTNMTTGAVTNDLVNCTVR